MKDAGATDSYKHVGKSRYPSGCCIDRRDLFEPGRIDGKSHFVIMREW